MPPGAIWFEEIVLGAKMGPRWRRGRAWKEAGRQSDCSRRTRESSHAQLVFPTLRAFLGEDRRKDDLSREHRGIRGGDGGVGVEIGGDFEVQGLVEVDARERGLAAQEDIDQAAVDRGLVEFSGPDRGTARGHGVNLELDEAGAVGNGGSRLVRESCLERKELGRGCLGECESGGRRG